MNRFEALHALGLEENASEQDVRLAYYGLEKAITAFDFSDQERLKGQADGMLNHAKEARSFLLNSRNQKVARKVQSYSAKQRGKLTVTPVEEKTARLRGCERVRDMVLGYAYNERSKIRSSVIALLLCIVVSFVILRYLRGMPRIVTFAVIGAVAVAGSTVLTTSIMQSRKARAHVVELDEAIAVLRRELGLEPAEEDGFDADEAMRRADAAAHGLGAAGGEDPDDADAPGEGDDPAYELPADEDDEDDPADEDDDPADPAARRR